MDKYYKQGFYLVLIIASIAITVLNLLRVNAEERASKSMSSINQQRLISLSTTIKIIGRTFNNLELMDVSELKNEKLLFTKPTLLIMLSDIGCSPCQFRELKIYQKLYDSNKINVIGIFNTKNRDVVLKMKKASGAEYPLYFGDEGLFKKFSFAEKYPQVLFVANNKIFSTFVPLSEDDEFSNWYARSITKTYNEFE